MSKTLLAAMKKPIMKKMDIIISLDLVKNLMAQSKSKMMVLMEVFVIKIVRDIKLKVIILTIIVIILLNVL